MNQKNVTYRFLAGVLVLLIIGNTQAYGAGPAYEELRKEAFLRGGRAITSALNAIVPAAPATANGATVKIPIPALPPDEASPQASSEKGVSKLLWVGLIVGFATTGGLVYHFAAGPGASVRNCSTCK